VDIVQVILDNQISILIDHPSLRMKNNLITLNQNYRKQKNYQIIILKPVSIKISIKIHIKNLLNMEI
jgi:hypothetical protein